MRLPELSSNLLLAMSRFRFQIAIMLTKDSPSINRLKHNSQPLLPTCQGLEAVFQTDSMEEMKLAPGVNIGCSREPIVIHHSIIPKKGK